MLSFVFSCEKVFDVNLVIDVCLFEFVVVSSFILDCILQVYVFFFGSIFDDELIVYIDNVIVEFYCNEEFLI